MSVLGCNYRSLFQYLAHTKSIYHEDTETDPNGGADMPPQVAIGLFGQAGVGYATVPRRARASEGSESNSK